MIRRADLSFTENSVEAMSNYPGVAIGHSDFSASFCL